MVVWFMDPCVYCVAKLGHNRANVCIRYRGLMILHQCVKQYMKNHEKSTKSRPNTPYTRRIWPWVCRLLNQTPMQSSRIRSRGCEERRRGNERSCWCYPTAVQLHLETRKPCSVVAPDSGRSDWQDPEKSQKKICHECADTLTITVCLFNRHLATTLILKGQMTPTSN